MSARDFDPGTGPAKPPVRLTFRDYRAGASEITPLAEACRAEAIATARRVHRREGRKRPKGGGARSRDLIDAAVMLVEAVGIEPTSEDPRPQASTSMSGLLYDSLALRPSIRQEDRGASLIYLARPLRQGFGPAIRI